MGWKVFKQPNGLYGIYSSIVDCPIFYQATLKEIAEHYLERERKRLKESKDYWREHAKSEWEDVKWSTLNLLNNITKEEAEAMIEEMSLTKKETAYE